MPKKTETRPATAHIAPFGLRMQAELREALEAQAERHGRSLNAEIVHRLARSFSADLTSATDEELLRFYADSIAAIDRVISIRVQELEMDADQLPQGTLQDQRDRLQVSVVRWRRRGDDLRHTLETALIRMRITWRRLYAAARTHGINLATDSDEGPTE